MNNNNKLFKDNTKCVFVDDSIERLDKRVNEIKTSTSTLIFIKNFDDNR